MKKRKEKGTFGERKYFRSGDLRLSYLEKGEENQKILLLLHGHMNDARNLFELANRFSNWRVIAFDQRGHGLSDHASDLDYSRDSYIQDIFNLLQNVGNQQPVTIWGHSLGGVNAYQFAARYPEWVEAVVVEDIVVEINLNLSFVKQLAGYFPTLEALKSRLRQVGIKAVDYFLQSVIQDKEGWRFLCDLDGIPVSQQHLDGSWWKDWQASSCPILLIRGGNSFVLDQEQAKRMVDCRPNTRLKVFKSGGHSVHDDDPEGFIQAVSCFFKEINI